MHRRRVLPLTLGLVCGLSGTALSPLSSVEARGAGEGPASPAEAALWLQAYLRLDTRNPPGHEHRGAAFLDGLLRREGVPTRLYVTPSGRANLWAELPGPPAAGKIVLLHHVDVVEPGPGWSVEPFAGRLRDGAVWGRGALDAKSLGIAQLAAFLDLRRRDARLNRGVVFLATADEETGSAEGLGFLLRRHPEALSGVAAVLTEGGANRRLNGRTLWWGVEVAQKRPLWLEATSSGRSGHASGLQPHSATHQLVAALARLLALPPRWRVSPAVRDYLRAVAPLHDDRWRAVFSRIDEIVAPEGPRRPLLPGMANLFLDSVQVTVLRAGDAGETINSIPAAATARIDARLLDDTDATEFLERVRAALGREVRLTVLLESPPAAPAPASGPVFDTLRQVLGKEAPVVPAFISGFTDSRFFRERGIPAYGFSPFALEPDELRGVHGPDERIPLTEFDRGVERMKRVLTEIVER